MSAPNIQTVQEWDAWMDGQVCVYIIHLDRPLKHARHYVGLTTGNPLLRLAEHRAGKWRPGEEVEVTAEGFAVGPIGTYRGNGSKFLGACNYYKIHYDMVRVWINVSRDFEKRLKAQHDTKAFCPVCCSPRKPRDL